MVCFKNEKRVLFGLLGPTLTRNKKLQANVMFD